MDPAPAPGGDLGELIRELQSLKKKVGELESPSGTQRYQSVSKLSALIDDIQAQLDDYIANQAYTKSQVDNRIANPPAGVNATGNVSATGDVSAGSALRGVNLYATAAPGFNITGTRVAAWLESATGRLGTASSSRRYKQDWSIADVDPDAVMGVMSWIFRYIEQVEELGDDAAWEYGFFAEDLHDAGLYPWVIYREINGKVVPDGVNYPMFVVAQQVALRHLDARTRSQQDQIDALTARLDALDGGHS
ncbi:hypothetical protein RS84_00258 [Microbacterium hydrocarbonoxydans]|uniref:Peptidase S74 domain-containing protein n=1 Tax=Microbacterium hydrocarbonoxydans TaxID=273678 RepID=A0A0M2HR25_9MICO|nr:tail fiber domain-containing protein [Microbacterium hydrocarbonoxydans]KJL49146.1 hypothetical protein RS84_00258 [Microbacterium hydrocarbonoxydans]